LATLRYPIPLDLQAAQKALDVGTLMVSYSVGEESTLLFAVSAQGDLEVHRLPIARVDLERRLSFFQGLMTSSHASLDREKINAEGIRFGGELFTLLLGPVRERIKKSRRLLIIPDGPLHSLPWSALVLEGRPSHERSGRAWQYLVERIPIHVALSATVYSELHLSRARRRPDLALVAFGDPHYPPQELKEAEADHLADPRIRSAKARGFHFTPLPGSRAEVTGVASLFRRKAQVFLGWQATEERAKSLSSHGRYLHYAAHGFLNERSPLDSGIALTIPLRFEEGKDNGLLQAWEIFERMHVEADVVVLSSCRTGLGSEMGGEGLISLTRAFQYAGARSVVASLWEVSDPAAADLMIRFYRRLRRGHPFDESLREAQINLIRKLNRKEKRTGGPEASSPLIWAAFQLFGDWK
jgi:CHAT domain-containing protein